MKAIVVAMDMNRGIGADNDLLWLRDLPDDLKHFKDLTVGTSVIMGRNTYKSMGRPLPDRQNIVVTSSPVKDVGVISVASLETAYAMAQFDIRVMGGGQIYAAAINDMDVLYVTEVQAEFPEASVFFPEIDMTIWRESAREHHEADKRNKYAFDFVTYERR
jgi:dihydrofolate reductase